MTSDKLSWFWLLVTGLLIVIVISSSLVIWMRYDRGKQIEILDRAAPAVQGRVYIEGAVANPGPYSFQAGDDIGGLIQASGGAVNEADYTRVRLIIPQKEDGVLPQKININRAESWLLQALPGIGEVRAQAIIDYRQQNGPFSSIEDLNRVPGISESTFNSIKPFITVVE
ncbi:MAG: ComEA family DNA-binding protein [Dehalococcoidales bacterium]|jgi:competence protein ComEA|nr:ComEA family DNA-binding protein [Dehalococcoidales bacterium]